MIVSKGLADQARIAAAIAEVEPLLGADVVRLRYTIGDDWSDDPAISFRVLLSDQASRPDRLHKVASRIKGIIQEHFDPLNSWGLYPYYTFRSQSEQDEMKEESWE